jgi:hypothetical protein
MTLPAGGDRYRRASQLERDSLVEPIAALRAGKRVRGTFAGTDRAGLGAEPHSAAGPG